MPTPHRVHADRIDPFDLRLFAAVVAQGTITAAAQSMHLSLAAASARLKALEHRVGTALLTRSKSGAVVTDAGQALACQAQRVLAELDALHLEMAAFGRGLRGTVRLLGNTAAMSELLPQRLARFLIEQADVDVDLQELSSEAVLEALRRGVAEVGIVADHVDTTGLTVQPWIDDELVALLPAARPSTGARIPRPLWFAQLLERPFVGLPLHSGLSRFLLQQAARSGRLPHHRVRVGHFEALAGLVAAGVGVTVMPRSAAVRWGDRHVRIAALQDAWARRTLLICSTPQAHQRPAAQALITALLQAR